MANHLLSKLSFQQIVIAGIRNVRLSNILQQTRRIRLKNLLKVIKMIPRMLKTKRYIPYLIGNGGRGIQKIFKESFIAVFSDFSLKDPDLLKDTVVRQNPDAIIIDDNVNGTNGDALCFGSKQIK